MTATFAADDFSLREDWYGDEKKGIEGRQARLRTEQLKPLWGIDAVTFLTAVTLIASYRRHLESPIDNKPAVSCKRRDILRLTLDEYRNCADQIERARDSGRPEKAHSPCMLAASSMKDLPSGLCGPGERPLCRATL